MSERSFYGFSTSLPPQKIRFYQEPISGRWTVIAVLYEETDEDGKPEEVGILTPVRVNERVIVEGVARFERALEAHDIAERIISLMNGNSKEKVSWKAFERGLLFDEGHTGFACETREKRQTELLSSSTRDDFLVKVGSIYISRKEIVAFAQHVQDETITIFAHVKNGSAFAVAGFNRRDTMAVERAMLQFSEIVNSQTVPETVKFRPCHALDSQVAIAERSKCDNFVNGKLLSEKQLLQLQEEVLEEQAANKEGTLAQKIAFKNQIDPDGEKDPDADIDDKLPKALDLYEKKPAPAVNDGYQFVQMKKKRVQE